MVEAMQDQTLARAKSQKAEREHCSKINVIEK